MSVIIKGQQEAAFGCKIFYALTAIVNTHQLKFIEWCISEKSILLYDVLNVLLKNISTYLVSPLKQSHVPSGINLFFRKGKYPIKMLA